MSDIGSGHRYKVLGKGSEKVVTQFINDIRRRKKYCLNSHLVTYATSGDGSHRLELYCVYFASGPLAK